MKHVTQILNDCGLYKWPFNIPEIDRQFYLKRGSEVHSVTAKYDLDTLYMDSVDPRIKKYLNGWIKFRNEVGGKIIHIEKRVQNKSLDYKGTYDRLIYNCALYPGGYFLLDIKTNEAQAVTRLQTMAYSLCQRRFVKRGYVALRSNGTYKTEIYDNDLSDKSAWLACVKLINWKERN
ncbi:MAG TPA: hypothetical protein VMV56_07495 [Williamwhitmania sp.]|nr:hypothetical protein [Williamwhitmania sp.]